MGGWLGLSCLRCDGPGLEIGRGGMKCCIVVRLLRGALGVWI